MIQEKIDLYAYFALARKGKEEGYLRTYALLSNWEMGESRLFPSLLVIPGGGYGMCSEREGEPIVLPFLKEGISGFVLNYTCAPAGYYPTCLLEAYMALIYLQENAGKYHLDPAHIATIGFSAGAHLCGLLSCLYDEKKILALLPTPHQIVHPAATAYCYPVVTSKAPYRHLDSFNNLTNSNPDLIKKLSLEDIIDEKTPASFVVATYNDEAVPVMNSVLLIQALASHHVPFESHLYQSGRHGISIANHLVYRPDDLVPAIELDASWVNHFIDFLQTRGFIPHD
jgi:acetyl esterase/lipase